VIQVYQERRDNFR